MFYDKHYEKEYIWRMKEIWRMWKLVCYFKNNRSSLALKLVEQNSLDKAEDILIKELREKINEKKSELKRELTYEERSEISRDVSKNTDDFKDFLSYREVSSYHKEATVNRNELVLMYISVSDPELIKESEQQDFYSKVKNKKLHHKKIEINSILEGCIDESNGYIKKDLSDATQICLTARGKAFASIDGLLFEIRKKMGTTVFYSAAFTTGALSGFSANSLLTLVKIVFHNIVGRL